MKDQHDKGYLEAEATDILLMIENGRGKSEAIANRLGSVFKTFHEAKALHLELQEMFDEIVDEDKSIGKRIDDYLDVLKTTETNTKFLVHHVMPKNQRHNYMIGFMKGVATVIMGWYEMHGDIEKMEQITKKFGEMSKEQKDLGYIGWNVRFSVRIKAVINVIRAMKRNKKRLHPEIEAGAILEKVENSRSNVESIASRLGRLFSTVHEPEAVHLALRPLMDLLMEIDEPLASEYDNFMEWVNTTKKGDVSFMATHCIPLQVRYQYYRGIVLATAFVIEGWYEIHEDIAKVQKIREEYKQIFEKSEDINYIM